MFEIVGEQIENDFLELLDLFPLKKREIIDISANLQGDLALLFKKLITQMPQSDILSIDLSEILNHVNDIYNVITNVEYCKNMEIDMILKYVLPYRVNDEKFTKYVNIFYSDLQEKIKGKTIIEAAKLANYYCLSKAAYQSSDDRTQNAITTANVSRGRCGEQSVLLVSVLRSIGIPSRQVYVPYWAHCDDNHAWVEFYDGEKWNFMGACEPEEDINIGWFNNAASRAPIVRYRDFEFCGRRKNQDQNAIYTTNLSTKTYADVKTIKVTVLDDGQAMPFTKVGIYTINYGASKLILELTTDLKGQAIFETGLCDFLVLAMEDEQIAMGICGKNQNEIKLDFMEQTVKINFDFKPIKGKITKGNTVSEQHIKLCEKLSSEREKNTVINSDLERFKEAKTLGENQKQILLSTLSQKDFADITYDVLMDAAAAFDKKPNYPPLIFAQYVLSPRVANETLYPHRYFVRNFFKKQNFVSPQDVYHSVMLSVKMLDSLEYPNLFGDTTALLKNRIASYQSFDIHFVKICRALGFAVRISDFDQSVEYYNGKDFVRLFADEDRNCTLKIINNRGKYLAENTDYSINYIKDDRVLPIKSLETIADTREFKVKEGRYLVTNCQRQIDGSVTGSIEIVDLENGNNRKIIFDDIADNTEKLLINGKIESDFENYGILAYIENGKEPTEHFLNELLENRESIKKANVQIKLYQKNNEKNQLFSKVLSTFDTQITVENFGEKWENIREKMEIGDHRLPFVTAAKKDIGLFSFANYNVGTVLQILKIFNNIH